MLHRYLNFFETTDLIVVNFLINAKISYFLEFTDEEIQKLDRFGFNYFSNLANTRIIIRKRKKQQIPRSPDQNYVN